MPNFPNIFGHYDSRDLAAVSLADYTEKNAVADLRAFAADYGAALQELLGNLAQYDTIVQANFGTTFGGELQPYVETGETEATRVGAEWTVGFPIRRLRDRQLYTEEYLARVTLEKLQQDVINAAARDYQTMLKMLLRALMLKTNYTFTDGQFPGLGLGAISVKRLANNDGGTGSIFVDGIEVPIGTLQSYIGSNNATLTSAAFITAYGKLRTMGKTGDVVFLINSNDEGTVRGFTEFYASNNPLIVDPNKKYAQVQSPRAIGRLEGANLSGEVVVHPYMPQGYFFAYDRSDTPPLKIRETTEPQFRGFRLVQDQTRAAYGEAALRNKRWERIAGAAVYNRVNGVAVQVVASTTYTDPTI
jgi:hypothetical protein